MAINLVKGQTIDLRKNEQGDSYDLSSVTIGLGWDIRKKTESSSGGGGLFGKLFSAAPPAGADDEFDLDAVAFLLDSRGKVANLGRSVQTGGRTIGMFEGDVIYFNSMKHPSGNIWLTGDNRTGAGEGDDEQIIVKLNALDPKYDRILFLVTIYKGRQKNQNFGMVENAFIRAVDNNGKEITRFSLSGDASFNGMCSITFAEAYRKEGSWKFRAIGEPHPTDSFTDILTQYT